MDIFIAAETLVRIQRGSRLEATGWIFSQPAMDVLMKRARLAHPADGEKDQLMGLEILSIVPDDGRGPFIVLRCRPPAPCDAADIDLVAHGRVS